MGRSKAWKVCPDSLSSSISGRIDACYCLILTPKREILSLLLLRNEGSGESSVQGFPLVLNCPHSEYKVRENYHDSSASSRNLLYIFLTSFSPLWWLYLLVHVHNPEDIERGLGRNIGSEYWVPKINNSRFDKRFKRRFWNWAFQQRKWWMEAVFVAQFPNSDKEGFTWIWMGW